jgi:hypothetical protein
VIQSAADGIVQPSSLVDEPLAFDPLDSDALDDDPLDFASPDPLDEPEVVASVVGLAASDEPVSDVPPLELELEPSPPSPDFAAAEAFVELAAPRSFFAQPEPLKWIVGGANCLRIVPSRPHDGQTCGPASLIPWMKSARCWHAVHRYS